MRAPKTNKAADVSLTQLDNPPSLLMRMQRLMDVGLRLHDLPSRAAWRDAVVQEAAKLLGAQRVLLVLLVPQEGSGEPEVAGQLLPPGETAEALLQAVTPWLEQARRVADTQLHIGPEGADAPDQRSCLVAPLIAQRHVIGCKVFGFIYADVDGAMGRFHGADRDLLATLATLACAALAHLHTTESLAQQVAERTAAAAQHAAELAVLNSIQQGIADSLDFKGIVELVGDRLREVVHAESLSIRRSDLATGLLHFLYALELGRRLQAPAFAPSEDSFCWVCRPVAAAMGQKAGKKWTAAVALQPTFLLPPTRLAQQLDMRAALGAAGQRRVQAAVEGQQLHACAQGGGQQVGIRHPEVADHPPVHARRTSSKLKSSDTRRCAGWARMLRSTPVASAIDLDSPPKAG